MALFECKHISKSFGAKSVLSDVSLSVDKGSIVAIAGISGGGKTVLLQHFAGLLAPDSGQVLFDGRDLATMNHKERRALAKRMGYMFQQGALFDSLSVLENLSLPLEEHTSDSKKTIRSKVMTMLERLDLAGSEQKLPHELSGGMLKRVGLARALMLEPEVVFCDEPTAGLDPVRAKMVYHLLTRVRKEFGTTLLVVTHDVDAIPHFADHVALLDRGRIASVEKNWSALSDVYRNFVAGSVTFLEGGQNE